MSRKDELLKLAQLFHSQARLTLDRPAKQALGKLGERVKKLEEQASADCLANQRMSSAASPCTAGNAGIIRYWG
jgi:hypothetical protein